MGGEVGRDKLLVLTAGLGMRKSVTDDLREGQGRNIRRQCLSPSARSNDQRCS